MSAETSQWLNRNVLVGYTAKRDTAWHYRASDQGAEPNHYEGPIPVADVHRRLFGWELLEAPVQATFGDKLITDDTRKVVARSDTLEILGQFKASYRVHGYGEWLIKNVESILDTGELAVGSAGLLRNGAVAWVQIEMEDTLEVAGVEYRPFLTAATSCDGSLATTYMTGAQVVVCDNTLQAARNQSENVIKVRHSKNSLSKIGDVREALAIIHAESDDFAAEVAELAAEKVSAKTWGKFVAAYSAPPQPRVGEPSKRAVTAGEKTAAQLHTLWRDDERVTPWAGTAYGVVAAVNTHEHHNVATLGRSKAERNAQFTITGRWAHSTADTLNLLASVN